MSIWDTLSGIGNGIEHFFGGGGQPAAPTYNAINDPSNLASYIGPSATGNASANQAAFVNANNVANTPGVGGFENWLNNSPLAPVANALGSVGVGYSSNSGAHLGTAAPAPVQQDPTASVNNATQTYMGQYGGTTNSTPAPPAVYGTSDPSLNNPHGAGSVNATNTQFMPANGFQPTPTGQPINDPVTGLPTSGSSSTTSTTPTSSSSKPTDSNNWGAAMLPLAGAAIGAAGSAADAYTKAQAAKSASDTVASGDTAALAQESKQFEETRQDQLNQYNQQQANAKPWLMAGQTAVGQINPLIGTYDPNTALSATNLANDPGYQWRLDQGMKALQNSAAANGNLLSGNTMKGITDYSQGAASQEYQNAYNRYNTTFGTKLNALQSTAGLGQTAVGQDNASGANYMNNSTQSAQNNSAATTALTTGGANAMAAGTIGAGDAMASGYTGVTNALTSALNGMQSNNLMNSMYGR